MRSTNLLINKLAVDYPHLQFIESSDFHWDPNLKAIFYSTSGDSSLLLHELSHALLGHASYAKDLELLQMERDAWYHANTILSPQYELGINEIIQEDALDTYRDWLHARSTCPMCTAIGVQTRKSTYKCIACETSWEVNDARMCALRKYVLNKKHTH